jgi:hypothetical protein
MMAHNSKYPQEPVLSVAVVQIETELVSQEQGCLAGLWVGVKEVDQVEENLRFNLVRVELVKESLRYPFSVFCEPLTHGEAHELCI